MRIIQSYDIDTTKIVLGDEYMLEVDRYNKRRLNEIIEQQGFPTKKMVGRDAMKGVFLIIQHADNFPNWQKARFSDLESGVKNGDFDVGNYAYLYDRIQVNT